MIKELSQLRIPYIGLLLGAAFVVIGVADNLSIGGYAITISNPILKWIVLILGLCLVGIGIWFGWREVQDKSAVAPADEKHLEHQGFKFRFSRFCTREDLNKELPFKDFISGRDEVLISGLTLVGTVATFRELITQEVEKGTNFKFLLLPPNFPSLEQLGILHNVSGESLLNDIKSALGHIKHLKKSITHKAKGSIEVKFYETIPSCSITMCDGNKTSGTIRCELFVYKLGVNERPVLELNKADGALFHIYRESIKKAWNEATINNEILDQ